MNTTHEAVMFSFTSLSILSLKEGAIYFGSAKRDRDLILFLCSSFSVSSLVPRDYGNIFVNNSGKWLRSFLPSPFPFAIWAHSHILTGVPRLSPVHACGSALGKPVQDAASGLEDGFVTTRKPGENKTMKYLHCYVRTCGYSFIEWLSHNLFQAT